MTRPVVWMETAAWSLRARLVIAWAALVGLPYPMVCRGDSNTLSPCGYRQPKDQPTGSPEGSPVASGNAGSGEAS